MIRALVLALVLAGCQRVEADGPDAQGYRWQKDGPVTAPVIVHRGVDVFLNCAFEEKAQSCAVHRADGCHIYLPPNAPEWMEAHERRHCDGWRHPDPLRGGLKRGR